MSSARTAWVVLVVGWWGGWGGCKCLWRMAVTWRIAQSISGCFRLRVSPQFNTVRRRNIDLQVVFAASSYSRNQGLTQTCGPCEKGDNNFCFMNFFFLSLCWETETKQKAFTVCKQDKLTQGENNKENFVFQSRSLPKVDSSEGAECKMSMVANARRENKLLLLMRFRLDFQSFISSEMATFLNGIFSRIPPPPPLTATHGQTSVGCCSQGTCCE